LFDKMLLLLNHRTLDRIFTFMDMILMLTMLTALAGGEVATTTSTSVRKSAENGNDGVDMNEEIHQLFTNNVALGQEVYDIDNKISTQIDEMIATNGFDNITKAESQMYYDNLVNQLTNDQKKKILKLGGSINKVDLLGFPEAWKYFLPGELLKTIEISGSEWAEIANNRPLNLALIHKIAILLSDGSAGDMERFFQDVNIPSMYQEEMGIMLGYHLSLAAEDFSPFTKDFSLLRSLPLHLVLPSSTSKHFFTSSDIENLLSDAATFGSMSPGLQVAWYTLFEKEVGWDKIVDTEEHIQKYGHLLGGAPLAKLATLDEASSPLLGNILEMNDLNPLRVQEIWKALDNPEKKELYKKLAWKLDSTQLEQILEENYSVAHEAHNQVENSVFVEGGNKMAFENVLLIAKFHHGDLSVQAWQSPLLFNVGKFIVALSIPNLRDLAPKISRDAVEKIMSPHLTYGQGMVIFQKYIAQLGSTDTDSASWDVFPASLQHLIPSKMISMESETTWTNTKDSMLKASRRMLPSQLSAMYESMSMPWWKENMEAILVNNPSSLESVMPGEFRHEFEAILETVQKMAREGMNSVTWGFGMLPLPLQTAWLEHVFEMEDSTLSSMWNVNRLLDQYAGEEPQDYKMTSLALKGLTCHCIHKIPPSDAMEVLAAYRFTLESDMHATTMPRHWGVSCVYSGRSILSEPN